MAMPLEGIRVVDLTRFLAGPFCTRRLGDLGAEVIKVEEISGGDSSRYLAGPKIQDTSSYFVIVNRNKKGITLNLRDERGKEILYDLAKISDVVVDNYRAGVTKKAKMDYETLKQYNPKIICCSISGFGQAGPYRDRPSFDHLAQALSGSMSLTGPEGGGAPCVSGLPIGDCLGGTYAALAVVSAIVHRELHGEGGFIDIALTDNIVDFLVYLGQFFFLDGKIPGPIGSGHPTNFHRAFRCRDGKWIQISCPSQDMWERLVKVLEKYPGFEGIARDDRFATVEKRLINRPLLWPILDQLFAGKKRREWEQEMLAGDVPHAPVYDIGEAMEDPQTLFRRMVVELEQPFWGKYKTLGMPIKMTQIQKERFDPPPRLGQHNEEILGGLLGYSDEEIGSLRKAGVIG
jgi:CoA:oxalate CoA-transferase